MLERSAKTELERKRKRRNARDYWLRDGDAAQTSTIIHPADVLLGSFATDPFSASGGQCLLCQKAKYRSAVTDAKGQKGQ